MLTHLRPWLCSTSCTAVSAPLPRSWRSRASATPTGVAPAARMISSDSRIAVPAVMTSSTISTRPCKRRADDVAALTVVLGLLAVEGVGDAAAVLGGQRDRRGGRERDALVGRPEEHVEGEPGAHDGRGIAAAEHVRRLPVAEQPGVEEVRALAPGLQREFAEPQCLASQGQVDESELVLLHVISLP